MEKKKVVRRSEKYGASPKSLFDFSSVFLLKFLCIIHHFSLKFCLVRLEI